MTRLPLLLIIGLLAADAGLARNRTLLPARAPVVQGGVAYVPGCPDWSDPRGGAGEATATNFGCATASNLAAMIANPADLLHGQADPYQPADTAARAVRTWRETVPTSKQWQVVISSGTGGGGK